MLFQQRTRTSHKLGGHSDGETPLPIPNREVKPVSADGTRGAIPRESRTPPITSKAPQGAFFFLELRGAQLLAPVRIELAQPAHPLAHGGGREEKRRPPLLGQRDR